MDDLSSLDVFDLFADDLFAASSSSSLRVERRTNQEKRLAHFVAVGERRRRKRLDEHKRRRQRQREAGDKYAEPRQKIPALTVAIDFAFAELMSAKELRKLSRQIGRIWGLQKRFHGLCVMLTSPTDDVLVECRRIISGFDHFDWPTVDESVCERFVGRRIVYLSPDAGLPPLLDVDAESVYVIGGLVDESGKGSQTKQRAADVNRECYRLPITEFMQRSAAGSFNVTLPINLVVEILCKYAYCHDWPSALEYAVPRRTGYTTK